MPYVHLQLKVPSCMRWSKFGVVIVSQFSSFHFSTISFGNKLPFCTLKLSQIVWLLKSPDTTSFSQATQTITITEKTKRKMFADIIYPPIQMQEQPLKDRWWKNDCAAIPHTPPPAAAAGTFLDIMHHREKVIVNCCCANNLGRQVSSEEVERRSC